MLGTPGIDINSRDSYKETVLFRAVAAQREDLVRALLNRTDLNVNAANVFGNTALHAANATHITRLLLSRSDIDVNPRAEGGVTPLQLASQRWPVDAVRALLSHADINPNLGDWRQNRTALHHAAFRGRHRVVKVNINCNP